MAKISANYGEIGTPSYSTDIHRHDYRMESFLWKLLLLSALAYFVWSDTISIGIGPFSVQKTEMGRHLSQRRTDLFGILGFDSQNSNTIVLEADAVDHLSFALDPTTVSRFGIPESQIDADIQCCSLFIKKFSPVAIAEMRRYGVPASILLAQALMASNAGENTLAIETHNFFLRHCPSNACKFSHFEDLETSDEAAVIDVFPNEWGSFRAQSLFFRQTAPYSNLFQLGARDYQSWAQGLQRAGYSTDNQYGQKLVAVIQTLKLDTFDNR